MRANRHAACGFALLAGMAQADPEAKAIGPPLRACTVSKAIGAFGETSLSTFTYHCSIGMAPSVPVANWLPAPKKSAESRNALTAPNPPSSL